MNSWSSTLSGGHKLANGPVQAAWCGEEFPRAAEIIRYTCDGWSAPDVAKFENMLATQYVPSLINGSGENGNKELSMSAALINIGVFNNDRATFDRGVKMWRGRAPAYIYLSSDGPTSLKAAGWDAMPIWGNKGQTTPYVDGLLQESVVWPLLPQIRSEEHTSELQSQSNLVCRLLLEKKNTRQVRTTPA